MKYYRIVIVVNNKGRKKIYKKIFLVAGDVVLPKVTPNPIDSHKPMYYKVNNDHHGDLLPLGHLECQSRGATTPWAKSNMGDLLPPEDIIIS